MRFKLISKGDRPFQIHEKINDNAYKLDLLGNYSVSATFNIFFYLFLVNVGDNSWKNSFKF